MDHAGAAIDSTHTQPLHVLLIFDGSEDGGNHDCRAISQALNSHSTPFTVSCMSGQEALTQLRAGAFFVVLVDMHPSQLPEFSSCREILAQKVHAPIVLLGGAGSETFVEEALALGAQDFIFKDAEARYLAFLPGVLKKAHRQWQAEQVHKEAQNSLVEAQRRWRTLVDNASVHVIELDQEGNILFINFTSPMHTIDEVTGVNVYQYLSAKEQDKLRDVLKRVFEDGETIQYESTIFWSNGDQIYYDSHVAPVFRDNKVVAALYVITDITEYKNTESKLDYQANLLSYMSDAVISSSAVNFMITSWNKAAENLYGWMAEEVIGKTFKDVLRPDYSPHSRDEAIAQFYAQDGHWESEVIHYHKDGTPLYIYSNVSLLKDREGQSIGVVGVDQDITDRKKAEQAQQESEARYRHLLNIMPDGVVVHRGSKVVLVNEATAKMAGAPSVDYFIGRDVIEFVHPDYRANTVQRIQKALAQPGSIAEPYEEKFLRHDGSSIDVEVTGISFLYDGQPAMMTIFRDISERKENERALQESETRYRQMFEHHPVVRLLIDPVSGLIMDANRAAVDFYGYSREELLSLRIQQINLLPDSEIQAKMAMALQQEQSHFYFEHRLASGEIRDVAAHVGPITVQGQNLLYSIIFDITEHRKVELALQKSEEMYRKLVEMAPSAVTMTNLEGQIIFASQRTAKLHQYDTPEELLAQHVFTLVAPEDHDRAMQDFKKTLTEGAVCNIEYTFLRKDGSRFPGVLHASLLKDGDGNPSAFMAIVTDITEEKNAEQQQLALQREKERHDILSRFLTNVSHEFRTPLTTISTSMYLAQKADGNGQQKRYFEQIKKQVDNLTRLVDNLTTMSRLESGRDILAWQMVDLNEVLYTLDDAFKLLNQEKQQQVAFHITTQSAYVRGDFDYLAKAFQQVWLNAIRYTPVRGNITVRAHYNAAMTEVIIEIANSGPPIPDEILPHIFERFFRDDTAGTTRGFGLGLPIAKSIVELHGGRIEVDTQPEQTTFRTFLPLSKEKPLGVVE